LALYARCAKLWAVHERFPATTLSRFTGSRVALTATQVGTWRVSAVPNFSDPRRFGAATKRELIMATRDYLKPLLGSSAGSRW
jgi:hypothetical protein